MWIPNSIAALIVMGTLYSLIVERPKGNHFESKKAPRRPSERQKTN